MVIKKCGPRENLKLRAYQEELVREILSKLKEGKYNISVESAAPAANGRIRKGQGNAFTLTD